MSLATAKTALRTSLLSLANNIDEGKTKEEAIDEFLDALETWITSATVTVPGTGLTAPNGPVTGTSTTGTLS